VRLEFKDSKTTLQHISSNTMRLSLHFEAGTVRSLQQVDCDGNTCSDFVQADSSQWQAVLQAATLHVTEELKDKVTGMANPCNYNTL